MADDYSPPRRIGEKKDASLHSPPQRHHPDPAAAKTQIVPLPTHKGVAGDVLGPDNAGHGSAVQQAIADMVSRESHPSSPTPPSVPATPPSKKMAGGPGGEVL
jgi:hypothetical protein